MKKSLVSALTTALVVGAASTTFAAANPFSDVPADHWAYDAVAQLAAEGVVEGYGDGTYRGEQEITRYEMAQMVAKAMAKGVNSAVLDKLAAEFADELNQLGVRVSALEKRIDNVKFDGELRYRYAYASAKDAAGNRKKANANKFGATHKNELLLRMNVSAKVNENWTVKSRFDYGSANDLKTSADADNSKLNVDRMYAEGKYKFGTIQLGKFNVLTNADYGLVNDDTMSGVSVEAGKNVKVKALVARYHQADFGQGGKNEILKNAGLKANTGNVWGIEVFNNRAKKFTYGIGYMEATTGAVPGEDKGQFLYGGLGYKFSKNGLALEAAYARNLNDEVGPYKVDSSYRERMAFTLRYKKANKAKAGSYGLWTSYLNVGPTSGLFSTYKSSNSGLMVDDFRGWEFGAQVTLAKNIQVQGRYLDGNNVSVGGDGYRGFFSQVDFWF